MNPYPPYPWQRRVEIVQAALAAMQDDPTICSLNFTARRLHVSSSSLSRWLRAYRSGGAEALWPKTGRPRKPKPPEAAA